MIVAEKDIGAIAHHLTAIEGARLADLFGTHEDGELALRAVFADDKNGKYAVLEWNLDGEEYASLSDIVPACFLEECEIYEQFGARPAGGKLLNRVLVPPHAEETLPRLGESAPEEGENVRAPFYVEGEAFEFPVGPVRGVAQESLYIGLVTSGEEVLDLYLHQWHKHRGAERRLQGLSADRSVFLVERLEGLSAVANAWAFCRAAEAIAGLDVPRPVQRSRAVALELERIYNHAAAIAALCQTTGLSVGQAQSEIALESFLRLNAAAAGHRYLFGLLTLGGTTRALDEEAIGSLLPPVLDELRRVVRALRATNSFLDRLEACGIVSPETATRLGLVGPIARACGRNIDCRRDHRTPPYDEVDIGVPVREAGDVLSRMDVMVEEIDESERIIGELRAAGLGHGTTEQFPAVAGSALGWCESPRGESLVWLDLDAAGLVRRARLRPASVRNWRAFDDAARSRNVFTDVPIIEASFWLTVAGFAR
jgi:Ni,Fe-hydrogenase III large subunit